MGRKLHGRKIFSILLILALCLAFAPLSALAEDGDVCEIDGTGYATLGAAITAAETLAEDEATHVIITLLTDITDAQVRITESNLHLTFDLNGCDLNFERSGATLGIYVSDAEVDLCCRQRDDDGLHYERQR
jgi:hypothetical protein